MSACLLSVVCCACALVTRAAAAPAAAAAAAANNVDGQATLLYTADHDVTGLGVIFGDTAKLDDKTVFFIESETDERAERVDYGLYALNHDIKTKLLENARDIAVINLATAYFAAKDGIYLYNKEMNSVQKYGSVTDEVISLAVENGTGVIYYLNEQHQLYKVTEGGNKSSIIDAVKNAEEIVVDYTGHLYYYTADKKFYVYDGRDVRKVEHIPDNMQKVRFLKSMVMAGEFANVIVDGQLYGIHGANASARGRGHADPAVTAASVDAGLVVYYAKNKNIYEFNILTKVVEGVVKALSKGFKKFAEELRDTFHWVYTS